MSAINFVTLSHSSAGYDSYDALCRIVSGRKKEIVCSYIEGLTPYASEPNYMSKNIVCKSLFRAEDDIVLLEAYPRRDTRLFIERKVAALSAQSQKNSPDLARYILGEVGPVKHDENFDSRFRDALLLALFSEKTRLFCLVDCQSAIDAVRFRLYNFGSGLLSLGSCIEVMKALPGRKYTAATCICVTRDDKQNFMGEIDRFKNKIIVDLTEGRAQIKADIPTPEYSQNVLRVLFDECRRNNSDPALLIQRLNDFVCKSDVDCSMTNEGGINAMMFRFAKNENPKIVSKITASTAERERLMKAIG